jgi:hypothetical protein
VPATVVLLPPTGLLLPATGAEPPLGSTLVPPAPPLSLGSDPEHAKVADNATSENRPVVRSDMGLSMSSAVDARFCCFGSNFTS